MRTKRFPSCEIVVGEAQRCLLILDRVGVRCTCIKLEFFLLGEKEVTSIDCSKFSTKTESFSRYSGYCVIRSEKQVFGNVREFFYLRLEKVTNV